jgi:hypothetical protein
MGNEGGRRHAGRGLSIVAVAVAAFLVIPGVSWSQRLLSQEPVPHQVLKERLKAGGKPVVVVQGVVTNWVDTPDTSLHGFYLKDVKGVLLLIRTTKTLPGINAVIQVKGVAMLDREPPFKDTACVLEEERVLVPAREEVEVGTLERPAGSPREGGEAAAPPTSAAAPGAGTGGGTRPAAEATPAAGGAVLPGSNRTGVAPWLTTPWVAGLSILGAALVIGAFVLIVSKKRASARNVAAPTSPADAWQSSYASAPTAAAGPEDAVQMTPDDPTMSATERPVVEDFKTVKAFKTSKVLPGRLIVIDNSNETDVIHLSDQSGRGEVEIGRDSPDATGGIRIKDKTNTLSRRQAKLTYDATKREFRLLNLIGDSGNPSSINGRLMHEAESVVLSDGDVLTMGNVELKFKQP